MHPSVSLTLRDSGRAAASPSASAPGAGVPLPLPSPSAIAATAGASVAAAAAAPSVLSVTPSGLGPVRPLRDLGPGVGARQGIRDSEQWFCGCLAGGEWTGCGGAQGAA